MTDGTDAALAQRIQGHGYALLRLIGEGAFAQVFEARDAQGRPAAVKVCTATDPDLRSRFAREGRLALRLRHPRLVPGVEVIEDPAITALVMAFVPGGSLRDRLEQGPLRIIDTLIVLAQIGSALEYAHGQGIIHRDVKPSNLLMVEDGVLLCDLGLARDLDATTALTETGGWVGTCEYFSPEQVDGLPAEAPADVFALGGVAYHALTGQLPFPAKSVLELARKIRFDTPKAIRRRRPDTPRELSSLVEAMLAKEPDDRPTAAEVAAEATRLRG